ncbi:MAG: glutaredoxin family protein [Thermodesulfobacteriota bacterium]
MEKAVIVFSAPTCPICKMLKEFLAERRVDYTDYDVTSDAEAFARMKKVSGGLRSVPVIKVGETVIAGFEEKELARALAGLPRAG